MKNQLLHFIKKYRYFLVALFIASTLMGTITLFAQKQETKLPENPINKEAISSTVLLAGSDKDVSKALKDSGVQFKKKKKADKKDEQQLTDKKTEKISQKHLDETKIEQGFDKIITPSKLKKKENKSDRTYFTTTIKDGEQVDKEAYKFKIIQKEADLKIEKQKILLNDSEVDFSGIVLLSTGENKIEVVMTYSNKKGKTFDVSKKYTVYFNSQIEIETNLENNKIIGKEKFEFKAYAIRNKKEEAITVFLNGEEVKSKKGYDYSITLAEGENLIELKAGSDKDKLEEDYLISYKKPKDPAKEKDEEKTEKIGPPLISIEGLKNGETVQDEKLTFKVSVQNSKNEPLDSYDVYLEDDKIDNDWKENGKSQHSVNLVESTNHIKVVANDENGSSELKYEIHYKKKAYGKATFSVEASTVGMNEVIPTTVLDLEEGVPAAQYVIQLLEDYGYSTGKSNKPQKNFYLDAIHTSGGDFFNGGTPKIPSDLKELLFEKRMLDDTKEIRENNYDEVYLPEDHGKLGEFDFTSGSGWMYSVNGVYPNVGFSEYFLKDGDVVRLRFTLMLGADIGGGFSGNYGDW